MTTDSQSDCGDASPQLPAQVEAVTRAVRDQGAKRVVLVGASLGGSVAVAAAKRTKADAIVDLSGPADFGALSITDKAPSITMPALFAFSNTDRSDLDQVRQNLKRLPSKNKIFLSYPAGHTAMSCCTIKTLVNSVRSPIAYNVSLRRQAESPPSPGLLLVRNREATRSKFDPQHIVEVVSDH